MAFENILAILLGDIVHFPRSDNSIEAIQGDISSRGMHVEILNNEVIFKSAIDFQMVQPKCICMEREENQI